MKNKKLQLNSLKIESFVTKINDLDKQTILGQENVDAASLKFICPFFKWLFGAGKKVVRRVDDSFQDVKCLDNDTAVCT